MAQQIINYGNTANDGTGDPLRDAFIKVDENFNQIWAAGPVGSNVTILNNTIAVSNTNGNLILSPNGIGVIQTNSKIVPRLDNTYDLGSSALRYRSAFIGAGGLALSGNLTIASVNDLKIPGGVNGYILQTDGNSNLSWVAYPGAGNGSPGGANTQVQYNANGLFGGSTDFTYNNVTGNLVLGGAGVGNITTGNVYATKISVNPLGEPQWAMYNEFLTAPTGAFWQSDVTTGDEFINSGLNGYLNLRTRTAGDLLASELHMEHGLVHIQIHDGTLYSWEFLDGGTFSAAGNITTPGNITANYYIGNGSLLTNLPGGVIQGNVPPPTPNASTLWWDDVTGRLYVWYDDGTGLQWVDAAPAGPTVTYGNANVSTYMASGTNSAGISTTGNIAGNYFVGNGSQLTGITASANTGNIRFLSDTIYDLNGMSLENTDSISYSTTAAIILPANTSTESIELNNLYGNIVLRAGAGTNYTGSWTFDNNGEVTFPGGTILGEIEGTNTFGFYNGNANTEFLIELGPTNVWDFSGNTGNLSLPIGGNIVGTTATNSGSLQWIGNSSGDSNGYTTLQLRPDDTRVGSDQYVILDPTAPGHIHIRAGGTQDSSSADLFLGGETSYFKVGSGANSSVAVSADSNTWTFSNTGNLSLPATNIGNVTAAGTPGESAQFRGARKIINGSFTGASNPFAVTLNAGGTPTVAYTASGAGVWSVKITFAVEGATLNTWEQFDVVACYNQDTPSSPNYIVSNRIKSKASITDTAVTVACPAGVIEISLNLPAEQTVGGWASFDAVEFGYMVD